MGSSAEDPNMSIDMSVGALVWVRRRNGCWWPGKIVGPDELPEGCVATPRAGTPVKLLGREDASVVSLHMVTAPVDIMSRSHHRRDGDGYRREHFSDWYNLEKSKRIKAFHCGEYEDCIEKAKAAATHIGKRGIKYARREDAILHALKLEGSRIGKDHQELSATLNALNGEQHDVGKSSAFQPTEESEHVEKGSNCSGDCSDSAPELSQSGVSFEDPDCVDSTKKKTKKRRTPNDSEDGGAEGKKRMKGLEDLGMGAMPAMKRKRSQVAHVHEFLKKKSRRRTLTKVLESTVMVPVPPLCGKMSGPNELTRTIASDSKISGLESHGSKNNISAVMSNNSDCNGASCENDTLLNETRHANTSKESMPEFLDVPCAAGEKQSAGGSQKVLIGTRVQSSQSSHVENLSLGIEEHNEAGATSSETANVQRISEKGASEWQLKGKRNSRSKKVNVGNKAETHVAGVDGEAILAGSGRNIGPIGWTSICNNSGSYRVKSRPIAEIQVDEVRGWGKSPPKRQSHTRDLTAELSRPYQLSRFTANPKYGLSDLSHHTSGSSLYDVTVKVESSYKPQHVPYISLMSKYNGQPITGHPLTVEALDDGSCQDLVTTSGCLCSSSAHDIKPNNDAPAPKASSKAYNRKPKCRRPSKRRSLFLLKPRKSRKNGSASKKIRKLSSLTSSHRASQVQKKKLARENPRGPSIACVPVQIVFSRIGIALNI